MVKTAGISVVQTVTLPRVVTGLPEAVTGDVNQDGQGTCVVNVNMLSKKQINEYFFIYSQRILPF